MPAQKRFKTDYPGVYYIKGKGVPGSGHKVEKIFYISYRKNGKQIQEKAGRQYQDDMTPARASGIRARRIEGKELSNEERRLAEEAKKKAEAGKWTIGRLWVSYKASRPVSKSLGVDEGRYNTFLKPAFENKEPKDLVALDIDRLRIQLLKKKSPQTVKHVLNLLTWIINYGVKNGLCTGPNFHIKKPTVNNIKTEDLTPDQLGRLLKAIDESSNLAVAKMMKIALFTGLRRSEIIKLRWSDIDFGRNFISIRNPKGGLDQKIPMNLEVGEVFDSIPKTEHDGYVFPGRTGEMRTISSQARKIRDKAGLPSDFRPFHGLRHVYASMLASSGQVDMYTLQKLLTHKSPLMTQRYAHLRDEALKKASELAGNIINEAILETSEKAQRAS
jgi:integrase